MATGVEASIFEGLAAHLSTLVLVPAMPVAFPNVNYEPDPAGYLSVSHIPTETNQIDLGDTGQNRFTGVFQVSVHWPRGQGEVKAQERAASVSAHFKRGTDISQDGLAIRIISPPNVAAAIYEDEFVQLPVSISYRVDAANP